MEIQSAMTTVHVLTFLIFGCASIVVSVVPNGVLNNIHDYEDTAESGPLEYNNNQNYFYPELGRKHEEWDGFNLGKQTTHPVKNKYGDRKDYDINLHGELHKRFHSNDRRAHEDPQVNTANVRVNSFHDELMPVGTSRTRQHRTNTGQKSRSVLHSEGRQVVSFASTKDDKNKLFDDSVSADGLNDSAGSAEQNMLNDNVNLNPVSESMKQRASPITSQPINSRIAIQQHVSAIRPSQTNTYVMQANMHKHVPIAERQQPPQLIMAEYEPIYKPQQQVHKPSVNQQRPPASDDTSTHGSTDFMDSLDSDIEGKFKYNAGYSGSADHEEVALKSADESETDDDQHNENIHHHQHQGVEMAQTKSYKPEHRKVRPKVIIVKKLIPLSTTTSRG